MHSIDLEKYEIRTDMAIDLAEKAEDKIDNKSYIKEGVKVSWITLDKKNNLGKKEGIYLTLEFNDVTDEQNRKKVADVFLEEFKKMLSNVKYNMNMKTLIVGLGNIKSTPDSLGPLVTDDIIITKHLFDMKIGVDNNFSNVSAINTGVKGTTGIETLSIIKAIVKETKPNLLIVIDSLASSSINRINRSIQVSNSGITPGSALGNKTEEISKETINIPVIAIGIPTVAHAAVIVSDTINYMFKSYSYNKKINNSKASKLVTKNINYINKEVEEDTNDRKYLLGLIGSLNNEELLKLTYEVLEPIGHDLMVTPKEVDFVIDKLSNIISYTLNHSLHNI